MLTKRKTKCGQADRGPANRCPIEEKGMGVSVGTVSVGGMMAIASPEQWDSRDRRLRTVI